METVFIDGRTPAGRHVRVASLDSTSPYAATVEIDGEPVEIIGHICVYRDGGTCMWPTEQGAILMPRRINSTDRTPTIEDIPILSEAP